MFVTGFNINCKELLNAFGWCILTTLFWLRFYLEVSSKCFRNRYSIYRKRLKSYLEICLCTQSWIFILLKSILMLLSLSFPFRRSFFNLKQKLNVSHKRTTIKTYRSMHVLVLLNHMYACIYCFFISFYIAWESPNNMNHNLTLHGSIKLSRRSDW